MGRVHPGARKCVNNQKKAPARRTGLCADKCAPRGGALRTVLTWLRKRRQRGLRRQQKQHRSRRQQPRKQERQEQQPAQRQRELRQERVREQQPALPSCRRQPGQQQRSGRR